MKPRIPIPPDCDVVGVTDSQWSDVQAIEDSPNQRDASGKLTERSRFSISYPHPTNDSIGGCVSKGFGPRRPIEKRFVAGKSSRLMKMIGDCTGVDS